MFQNLGSPHLHRYHLTQYSSPHNRLYIVPSLDARGRCQSHCLTIFTIFQVDENGKISRLRRECPSESCGAGVFMASMHDRQYCGKCYTTLVYKQREDK